MACRRGPAHGDARGDIATVAERLADGASGCAVRAHAVPAAAADARADRRRHRRGDGAARRPRRSSSSSTAPASRSTRTATTSACTRAPRTTSRRPCPRWSRPSARRRRAAHPRRRGDRAPARRPAAAVPGHDEPVRARAGRRRAARELPLSLFLFDCLHLRRRALLAGRRATLRRAASASPADNVVPRLVTGERRGGDRVLRRRAAHGPRRRDGEGARRAVRRRQPRRGVAQDQARPHARPGGARRRVGPRPPAAAGSPTCTSARAIRRPAGSSCSARRSRA